MQNDDAPLTAAEAGAILGVSARTVTRRAESGELEYIRKLPGPNGDYLFSRTSMLRVRDELAAATA